MFKELKPNIVIHLAALVGGVHHNIEEPVRYLEENILAALTLSTSAFKHLAMFFLPHTFTSFFD